MENFEQINNTPEGVSIPEESQSNFQPEKTNQESWAKEGELKREMNIKEGNERCVLRYEELLDKAKEEVLGTFE